MTREERQQHIQNMFPDACKPELKEDILRGMHEANNKPKAWVEWSIGILVVCAIAAYIYSNYIVTPGQ